MSNPSQHLGNPSVHLLPSAGTPAPHTTTSLRTPSIVRALTSAWSWLSQQRALRMLQPKCRRLQVHETVQLGDKRFVSILRVDGAQFLIGGSSSGIALLAAFHPDPAPAAPDTAATSFADILQHQQAQETHTACA